jgi:ketohexokinase
MYLTEILIIASTIGAGDTFIAGMLYAWLCQEDWDLTKKIHFANRVAGMKVGQDGFSGLDKALASF